MPIRPEYRKFYNARWRRFRLTVIEGASGKGQVCGREYRMLNVAHLANAGTSAKGGLTPDLLTLSHFNRRFSVCQIKSKLKHNHRYDDS